ncbi:MAG: hypothetical protein KUG80_06120 [Gammaproteobacteria bacterium]|nr:hypothetical protein [Gammaproteobacteria bacterium]
MFSAALAIFIIVFMGGAYMLYRMFQDEDVPLMNAVGHGAMAIVGLVVLYLAVSAEGEHLAGWIAFFLYIAAALGGITLAAIKRVMKKDPPQLLAVAHAGIACCGCVAISIAVVQVVLA